MIFTSQKAADRWAKRHISSRMIFMNNLEEWQQSAVMCDGDVRKPVRMRNAAESALAILDRLNGEVDAAFRKDNRDLACDINRAMGDLEDILIRLEALE